MLSGEDRLTAVSAGSTAERLCGDLADDAMGEQLHRDLDRGEGEHLERALRILAEVTTEPELLTYAAARHVVGRVPARRYALRLLVAAGADEVEARRIQAARGHGWSTPQAEKWRPDSG